MFAKVSTPLLLLCSPPAVPSADDCEVGAAGRKACANCSCGRAEAEAAGVKVDLTQDMLDNPVSACGSVGVGLLRERGGPGLSGPGLGWCLKR